MHEEAIHETSAEARGEQTPRGRERTCVGCGERVDVAVGHGDLVRLVLGPGGTIAVDARGGGFGRGAHVHARRGCLERAVQRGLARAAKGRVEAVMTETGEAVPLSVVSLAEAIRWATERRIEGFLVAAVRSRQVALGADAVMGACQRGEAALVVVACDAAAAADLGEVRRAVAGGRGVAWGTKERLAEIASPGAARAQGLGVLAILSDPIGGALREAVLLASACAAIAAGQARPAAQGEPQRRVRRRDD